MPRAWTDDDAPFARDGMQAHERVKALVETLEVTKAGRQPGDDAMLCEQMRVGGASAMSYAMSIGARGDVDQGVESRDAGRGRGGDGRGRERVGEGVGAGESRGERGVARGGGIAGGRAGVHAGGDAARATSGEWIRGRGVRERVEGRGFGVESVGGGTNHGEVFPDAAPELVRDLSVLEIGAGCGVCGLVAARLGASRAVVTDGAPGALDAIRRSVVGLPEECARNASAAFFDFRDDQDVLNGTVSIEDARAGTGVDHWVHSRPHALKATTEACKLPVDETFDVVVATDVLYSDDHAGPLAASFIRRMKPSGRGFILNACRNGTLIAHFIQHLLAHGVAVRISAAERFDGEREFSQYEGVTYTAISQTPPRRGGTKARERSLNSHQP